MALMNVSKGNKDKEMNENRAVFNEEGTSMTHVWRSRFPVTVSKQVY